MNALLDYLFNHSIIKSLDKMIIDIRGCNIGGFEYYFVSKLNIIGYMEARSASSFVTAVLATAGTPVMANFQHKPPEYYNITLHCQNQIKSHLFVSVACIATGV